MNVRLTIILLIALAIVGGIVYFYLTNRPYEPAEKRPLFYKVEMSDIVRIEIESQGQKVSFVNENDKWYFDDEQRTPVNHERFGGTPLLLSGPRAERLVMKQIDDPNKYGLNPPHATSKVTLKNGQSFTLHFGNYNVDGSEQYAQLEGSPGLYLVVSSWTQVVKRLAEEPPTPTPEPTIPPEETIVEETPEVEATATPGQ